MLNLKVLALSLPLLIAGSGVAHAQNGRYYDGVRQGGRGGYYDRGYDRNYDNRGYDGRGYDRRGYDDGRYDRSRGGIGPGKGALIGGGGGALLGGLLGGGMKGALLGGAAGAGIGAIAGKVHQNHQRRDNGYYYR